MPVEYTSIAISTLPTAGGVSDSDLLPIVQSGVTNKITKSALEASLAIVASGPVEVEVVGSDVITVQAGKLLTHVVLIGSPAAVLIGTTEGGGEILDDEILGTHVVFALPYYFLTETQVWFTGNYSAKVWLI
jgi:citrate lyase alpha subunit